MAELTYKITWLQSNFGQTTFDSGWYRGSIFRSGRKIIKFAVWRIYRKIEVWTIGYNIDVYQQIYLKCSLFRFMNMRSLILRALHRLNHTKIRPKKLFFSTILLFLLMFYIQETCNKPPIIIIYVSKKHLSELCNFSYVRQQLIF